MIKLEASVYEFFLDCEMDRIVGESLTTLDASLLLCEFLECVVQQIIASRKLYDARLFEDRRLYNLLIKRSLYPKLNDYIHHTILSLQVYPKHPIT